jgi:hypothetical protein
MANKHPYATSSGGLTQTLNHLRKAFPASVDSSTISKLGFAPNNESYIVNVIRFLGFINEEGGKTDIATSVFQLHDDKAFHESFAKVVQEKYSELHELYQEDMWDLDSNSLISFFRKSDSTTDKVGKLQAKTFEVLAEFSGHTRSVLDASTSSQKAITKRETSQKAMKPLSSKIQTATSTNKTEITPNNLHSDFSLTVRLEINLPSDASKETYDSIFQSIRENLLNGN